MFYFRIWPYRTAYDPELHSVAYRVIRRTPKGVWLDTGSGTKRFVLDNAKRRFACPTMAEAYESFIARKKRQIKILRAQLQEAEELLDLAQLMAKNHAAPATTEPSFLLSHPRPEE